jgi:hypothetical protein
VGGYAEQELGAGLFEPIVCDWRVGSADAVPFGELPGPALEAERSGDANQVMYLPFTSGIVERPDGREREPAIFAPGEKSAAGARIGPPRVIVVDIGGEEFDVAPAGGVAQVGASGRPGSPPTLPTAERSSTRRKWPRTRARARPSFMTAPRVY